MLEDTRLHGNRNILVHQQRKYLNRTTVIFKIRTWENSSLLLQRVNIYGGCAEVAGLKKEQNLVISEKESSKVSDEGLVLKHIHFLVHGKTSIISLRVPEFWIFQDKGTIRIIFSVSCYPLSHIWSESWAVRSTLRTCSHTITPSLLWTQTIEQAGTPARFSCSWPDASFLWRTTSSPLCSQI